MSDWLIRCGKLFDGSGFGVTPDARLVVADGTIRATPTGRERVLDLGDCFVMPGFVDAHAHLSVTSADQTAAQRALTIPANLQRNLRSGTTTMRVMGEGDWLDIDARDAVEAGTLEGPELVVSARAVSPGGDDGHGGDACSTPDEVRARVRENLDRGADFIKIRATAGAEGGDAPLLTDEAVVAAVDEAASRGADVAAHAHSGDGLASALRAGVRSIEHAFYVTDDDLTEIVRRRCWVVTTYAFDFHPDGYEREVVASGDAEAVESMLRLRDRIEVHARRIMSSGARIAFGTNRMHGHMADEIALAVRFGLPVGEALSAATLGGARLLRRSERIGSLEIGKQADLVAFRADPFTDLGALARPVLVMKAGAVVWSQL